MFFFSWINFLISLFIQGGSQSSNKTVSWKITLHSILIKIKNIDHLININIGERVFPIKCIYWMFDNRLHKITQDFCLNSYSDLAKRNPSPYMKMTFKNAPWWMGTIIVHLIIMHHFLGSWCCGSQFTVSGPSYLREDLFFSPEI